jgi:hypothetical protein
MAKVERQNATKMNTTRGRRSRRGMHPSPTLPLLLLSITTFMLFVVGPPAARQYLYFSW